MLVGDAHGRSKEQRKRTRGDLLDAGVEGGPPRGGVLIPPPSR